MRPQKQIFLKAKNFIDGQHARKLIRAKISSNKIKTTNIIWKDSLRANKNSFNCENQKNSEENIKTSCTLNS